MLGCCPPTSPLFRLRTASPRRLASLQFTSPPFTGLVRFPTSHVLLSFIFSPFIATEPFWHISLAHTGGRILRLWSDSNIPASLLKTIDCSACKLLRTSSFDTMSGLSQALGKIRAQCKADKPFSQPTTTSPNVNSVPCDTALTHNHGDLNFEKDKASETSFHSAVDFRRSSSPSPAPVSGGTPVRDKAFSLFVVEIPRSDAGALDEYDAVSLDSGDEHFPRQKQQKTLTQDIVTHKTPSSSSNPRRSGRIRSMSLQPRGGVAVFSRSSEIFEDDPDDDTADLDSLVELEDACDADWLPNVAKGRIRSTCPTPNSPKTSRMKTTSYPTAPKREVLTSTSSGITELEVSSTPNKKTRAVASRMTSKPENEIIGATPRRHQNKQQSVKVDSDVEILRIIPRKGREHIKKVTCTTPTILAEDTTVPNKVRAGKAANLSSIPMVQKEQFEIDLTMLSSSESSEDGLEETGSSKGNDTRDSADKRGPKTSDGRSKSGDLDKIPLQPRPSQFRSPQDEAAFNSADESSDSDDAVEDTPQRSSQSTQALTSVTRVEANEHFERTAQRAGHISSSATSLWDGSEAQTGVKHPSNNTSNNGGWRKGEPYIPCENPPQRRGLKSCDAAKDEEDNDDGIKGKIKRRKLDNLASATIRDGIREGITPHYVPPRRQESRLLFASRILEFKLAGWKRKLVVLKQRKVVRRAR